MRLLDAATVVTGDTHFPIEGDERDSSVDVVLTDACTAGDPLTIGVHVVSRLVDIADTYTFRPFGMQAEFTRYTRGEREDDQTWLEGMTEDATEQAAGKALVVQPYANADVWIGSPAAGQATGEAAARALWFTHHVGDPILHVDPANVPSLISSRVLKEADDGDVITAWGDRVVINAGYAGYPSFWTGEIAIFQSTVQYADESNRDYLGNRVTTRAYRTLEIDTQPHSIVRAGAMPA